MRLENECTQSNGFNCYDVANQKQVLETEISTPMVDHMNGTYTGSYTVNLDGTITLMILLYQPGGLYYEFWDSSTWTGTIASSGIQSTINNGWSAVQNLTPTRLDYVTARFVGALRAPISGTVTIYAECDDTCQVSLDDNVIINAGYGNFSADCKS